MRDFTAVRQLPSFQSFQSAAIPGPQGGHEPVHRFSSTSFVKYFQQLTLPSDIRHGTTEAVRRVASKYGPASPEGNPLLVRLMLMVSRNKPSPPPQAAKFAHQTGADRPAACKTNPRFSRFAIFHSGRPKAPSLWRPVVWARCTPVPGGTGEPGWVRAPPNTKRT